MSFTTLRSEIARRLAALHTTPHALYRRPPVDLPPISAKEMAAVDAISADLSVAAEAVRAAVFTRVAAGADGSVDAAELTSLHALRTTCVERLTAAIEAARARGLVANSEARIMRGGPASIDQVRPELLVLALAEELAWHVLDCLRAELTTREEELRTRAHAADLSLCAALGLCVDDPSAPQDAILEALRGPAPQRCVLELFEPSVAASASVDGSLYQVEIARLAALRGAAQALAEGSDPHARVEVARFQRAIASQAGLQRRFAHLAG